MLVVSILLYGFGLAAIAATIVPFSPMTLKLYMPSREAIDLDSPTPPLSVGDRFTFVGNAPGFGLCRPGGIGWAWAVVITLVALAVLFWSNYVPLIMRPPPRKKILSVDEASHLVAPDADVLGVVVMARREPIRAKKSPGRIWSSTTSAAKPWP